jgi:diguanylate cyclase (GGDEF)-like protein/hemerythrin-like metal-binding protein/PAS domain S-box-containing protein
MAITGWLPCADSMNTSPGLRARVVRTLAAGLIFLVSSTSCLAADEPVTLQLKWLHQFQFAGYYAAQEKGFYREAGVDVRIIEAKPDTDVIEEVVTGRAEYGVGTSALVLSRQQGKPVVAIAVIYQHSPLVLLGRSDSGIGSVHDLKGKRVMFERHAEELLAYLRREGISENLLHIVPYSFDPNDLINGRVDAISAYSTDEPFFLDQAKTRYVTFSPRAAGIDFYGDNLFTSEAEIRNHPARVKAFRSASLKGWEYAMSHPEEIADLILRRYGNRHSRAFLLAEAGRMNTLIRGDLVEMGYMHEGRWQHISDTYAGLGLLPSNFPLQGFLYAPETSMVQERRWWSAGLGIALALGLLAAVIAGVLLNLNRRMKRELAARERAVAELGESEKNFRFIAENSADVIWIMEIASGRFTYISPSVYRLRGYTPEEIMAQPVEAALTPDSAQVVKTVLGETMRRWEGGEKADTMRVTEVDQPHKDGHLIATEVVTTLHANSEGRLDSVLGVTRDITERKRSEEAVRQMAFYDQLTQLPNRRLLLDRLPQMILLAKRDRSRVALLFIDLDKFKPINDARGHDAGDWLLLAAAKRIQGCIRESDTAARIGGDEFVVLLPNLQTPENALVAAENIRAALQQPFFPADGDPLVVSSSIGVSLYPDQGDTGADLLRLGDEAMYCAKKAGGNMVRLCSTSAGAAYPDENGVGGQPVVRLAWKASFASGNPTIDQEHRELFHLANELLKKTAAEPIQFNAAFDALLAHVVEHFAHEEAILVGCGYDRIIEHAERHQALVRRALELRRQSDEGGVSLGELIEFLVSDMVAGHMLRMDRDFFGLFADTKGVRRPRE